VVGTDPVAGTKTTKGADVTVLISVGYPRLAYDDGANVLMADGGSGKKLPAITKGTAGFLDPTWSPDGKTLVFRSKSGQLFLIDSTKKDDVPHPITGTSDELHDPTFAPSPKGDLLAAIRRKNNDGDLCLLRLNGTQQVQPNCIPDPQWDLGNRIAWSPDGLQILVPGSQPPPGAQPGANQPNNFGLIQYKSSLPFTADQNQWGQGKPVTDVSTPGKGVIGAAFAPNGKQIALVADTDNDQGNFKVFLIKPNDFFMAKAKTLPIPACDVSWRPDGGELLIAVFQQGCGASAYTLARVDPAKPTQLVTLVQQGLDPTWQPVKVATAAPLANQQPTP
jgi:WD40 repeat protein